MHASTTLRIRNVTLIDSSHSLLIYVNCIPAKRGKEKWWH